jgi:hypothetical protein
MSYELNPVQAATTPEWDLVDCLKRGGQPNFDLYTYVRWVGVQWSEQGYGGFSGPNPPSTINITTGWLPLRTVNGQPVTYGIGGIEWALSSQTGVAGVSYSAEYYLGPWYSNIDIYIPSYPVSFSPGGAMDVFMQYTAIATLPVTKTNLNFGANYMRNAPDTSNFATSRGRWEFANGNYEVIETWEGYSRLRSA